MKKQKKHGEPRGNMKKKEQDGRRRYKKKQEVTGRFKQK